jgi:hypothetical protein
MTKAVTHRAWLLSNQDAKKTALKIIISNIHGRSVPASGMMYCQECLF